MGVRTFLDFFNQRKFANIYDQCADYTMTSKEKMLALYQSVKYIVDEKIPGSLVECGAWKGGSAMLMALTLTRLRAFDRKIYLYDTFQGMAKPTANDYRLDNHSIKAKDIWEKCQGKTYNRWCFSSLAEVKQNMLRTGYPRSKIIFIKGTVEKTIPKISPSRIALLRLDTDWYQSTKHELVHLFPLLSPGGVIIIDDYGYWAGAKKAVDEYFSNRNIVLRKIDNSDCIGIKE